MNYRIILPPDLGMGGEEFARAWNADSEARAVAEAVRPSGFEAAGEIAGAVAVVLGNIATSIAAAALYDQIKRFLARRGVSKPVEVTTTGGDADNPIITVTTTS